MNQERLYQVILGPHVSDKAFESADEGRKIVFKVSTNANKLEIKKAVEQLFEVKVDGVKTVNVKGKPRRFGRITGRTKDWKKAYVTLQEGFDINFMNAE
ncbi:50S ribosomal protein L23 [Thiotrichales bacterium 19S11-10]|nr:50S ribosomal protein L23 [Thiotrichales bacterium 19S11-10]MCF6807634.1 50S ribosomal protein L23 [Thiotrichales bacterium 19S9-11]MCF6811603.1 50S ribosomal protein L23 [Thiotrichales bacterium 19S9-12]